MKSWRRLFFIITPFISVITTSIVFTQNSNAIANSSYTPSGYNLVWNDEFNDNTIDNSKWTPMSWHYSGLEYMSSDDKHLFQKDGELHLVTTKSGNDIIRPSALSTYRTGSLWTNSTVKEAFRYGYMEIRMKAKLNDGSWPAFWMLSSTTLPDRTEHDWYAETDIVEACGKNLGCGNGYNMSSKIKWAPGYSPDRYHYASQGQYSVNTTDGADGREWVTYGFLWTPYTMETFVNGRMNSKISLLDTDAFDAKLTTGQKSIYAGMGGFHDPSYLLISGGAVKTNATNFNKSALPFDTAIDYIRVYQKPGEGDIYITPQITTNKLPAGSLDNNYNSTIATLGRPLRDNKFEITSGKLPDGLSIDINTGTITGRPSKIGSYSFTVRKYQQSIYQRRKKR